MLMGGQFFCANPKCRVDKPPGMRYNLSCVCGRSSSGRARPCQGRGSEFEPRRPLQKRRDTHSCVSSFLEQHFCFAKVVACGRMTERERGNPPWFPPHTPPSLRHQEKLAASTSAKRSKRPRLTPGPPLFVRRKWIYQGRNAAVLAAGRALPDSRSVTAVQPGRTSSARSEP